MTSQEIFDKVITHLRTQGEKAHVDSGSCKYRMEKPDGTVLRCAVGCLISNEQYNSNMERMTLTRVLARIGLSESWALLDSLQVLHDYGYTEEKAEKIAIQHNLNFNLNLNWTPLETSDVDN